MFSTLGGERAATKLVARWAQVADSEARICQVWAPADIDGEQRSPEQMIAEIRRLQKENEYLKRQREILKKAMSNLGGGTEFRYGMIKKLSVDFDVKESCEALGVFA